MSDRRSQHYPPAATAPSPSSHWSSSHYQSGYANTATPYPSPSYPSHPSLRSHGSAVQGAASYDPRAEHHYVVDGHSGYHNAQPQMHYSYAPRTDRSPPMQMPSRPTHSTSGDYTTGVAHSPSRLHPSAHVHASSPPRSYSISQSYVASSSPGNSSLMGDQYPAQIGFTQQGFQSQYPASPQRPFSCDMCALSFNRQHDLKRHRDTHTGEKPFLCNGGCGKTFTRKDALKRHQLVKRCGIDSED